MIEINAAILKRNIGEIAELVEKSLGIVDTVQIDVCDGRFVESRTFMSAGCLSSAKQLAGLVDRSTKLELDMMIDWDVSIPGRFKKWLMALSTIDPDRVVLHYGSTKQWADIFNYFKSNNPDIEFGLAVHTAHTIKDVLALYDAHNFSYIQVMGIEKVGFGGQTLSPKALSIIKELDALRPEIPLSIDGGVKVENAKELVEAGITRLASGSGIFDAPDVAKRVEEFRTVINT